MEYDFLKAFMLRENRRGLPFMASPSLTAYINERIGRELQHQAERTAGRAQAPESSKSEVGGENTQIAS